MREIFLQLRLIIILNDGVVWRCPKGQESFFKVTHLAREIHWQIAIERSQIYTAIPDGRGPCIFTTAQMDYPLYLGRLNTNTAG